MRTEQSPPVRLQDYRPPDWLVETVDLDVALDPKATRVRARLTFMTCRRRCDAGSLPQTRQPHAFDESGEIHGPIGSDPIPEVGNSQLRIEL
jgi:hypothetical protein